MALKTRSAAVSTIFALFLLLSAAGQVSGGGYPALEGIESMKIVYDFRARNPETAERILELISDTLVDKNIESAAGRPEIIVVFLGPAVKLMSTNQEGFSARDKTALDNIAKAVTKMSGTGIKFEICLYAARRFEVDPATILPEILQVGNGWISLAGYQTNGFALVTAY